MPCKHRYYKIYKPFRMLSQFGREASEAPTLADLSFSFPKDVYPLGRLDADSEGLLLLSNDKGLNHRLLNPAQGHERSYLVQVEGLINEPACLQLSQGMDLHIQGRTRRTLPSQAELIEPPPWIKERVPPVRFRKHIPTSWLRLTLREGKNRQVRKMTAKAGFPTLRLIRERIGHIGCEDLDIGEVIEIPSAGFYELLGLSGTR